MRSLAFIISLFISQNLISSHQISRSWFVLNIVFFWPMDSYFLSFFLDHIVVVMRKPKSIIKVFLKEQFLIRINSIICIGNSIENELPINIVFPMEAFQTCHVLYVFSLQKNFCRMFRRLRAKKQTLCLHGNWAKIQ